MRYLIGLLITMAVIIFVIVRLLTGGSSAPLPTPVALASYADSDTKVRMTISNPVQTPEAHREVEITVGRDTADFVLYKGYDQTVVRAKSYDTGTTAYKNFLRSLDLSGQFTKGNDDKAIKDETGYCALGDRYTYEIIDGDGNVKQHYWSTSCGQKTFKGNADNVQSLFQKQIPDFFTLTSDVDY